MERTYPIVTEFANQYGRLTLEIVGEFVDVRTIKRADVRPDCFFSTETAEQVALITENRHIQLCPPWPIVKPMQWYLCVHNSPSTAAVARVVSVEYTGTLSPQEEIQRANRAEPRCLV